MSDRSEKCKKKSYTGINVVYENLADQTKKVTKTVEIKFKMSVLTKESENLQDQLTVQKAERN